MSCDAGWSSAACTKCVGQGSIPAADGFDINGPKVQKLRGQISNPWVLRAFMSGKLSVDGDMGMAMKLGSILG